MKNKYVLPLLSGVCVLAVIGMILALTLGGNGKKQAEFSPPPFDDTVQSGMPEVSDESYTKVYQDGMSFTAYVCGKVSIKNGSADVYFTSVADNTVWLKLRITDEAGNILGETGLLKPDEYVKAIKFDTAPDNGAKIKLKIMAYEPETYYSAGSVSLNTTADKGE